MARVHQTTRQISTLRPFVSWNIGEARGTHKLNPRDRSYSPRAPRRADWHRTRHVASVLITGLARPRSSKWTPEPKLESNPVQSSSARRLNSDVVPETSRYRSGRLREDLRFRHAARLGIRRSGLSSMKGSPCALVASVLAASTAALTSASGDQNVAFHPRSAHLNEVKTLAKQPRVSQT